MIFHSKKIQLVLGLFCSFSITAVADFSNDQPLHHFYNSRLLDNGEYQISIYGNGKIGVTENFEVGTQGLVTLAGAPNIALKHRMFKGDFYETSFTSHSFYAEYEIDLGSIDVEEQQTAKNKVFISALGVINTYDLDIDKFLNVGVLDYYIYQTSNVDHETLNIHILTPVLGYDHYLSKSWALTAVVAYPFFLIGRQESDLVDVEINLDLLTGIPSKVNPSTIFLTLTRSWSHFNMELGILRIAENALPYFNIFWRFH